MNLIISCSPKDTFSRDGALMSPGDIVVSNQTSDSALLLDKDGNLKKIIYNAANNLEQIFGVNWNNQTNEVLLTINGSPDRVLAVSAYDGSIREAVRHPQLNGNIYGVAADSNGDFLVIETSRIEKFTANNSRVNNGTFPTGNILTASTQINMLSTGDFVLCGTTTDRVRIYNSSAVQQAEAQSGVAGTTNAYGCAESSNGNIISTWDGTTDTVIVFNSDLSSQLFTYSDTNYIGAPRGVTVKANGNILVTDNTYEWIVELDDEANFIRTLGSGILNNPWQLIEIPEY